MPSQTTPDLQIDVQEPASWRRRLSITVPAERVQRVRRKVTAQIAGNVRLPGFRKGKMPSSLLEKQFGPAIHQETVDRVVQEAYREALDSQSFQPISQGQVGDVEYAGGDAPLTFHVEFEVQPTLELARTGGFVIQRPPEEVGQDEVDSVLERLRDERGTRHPLEEGTPDYGDTVKVAIERLDAPEGEAAGEEEYAFELGAGQAIPDIEQAIITLAPGEEGEFTVRFPDDFPDEAQRGVEQRLRIRLLSGERKELPPLDDAFAAEMGDFETLDALRDRVRADLQGEARRRGQEELRSRLIHELVEANPFDVPDSMVDRYVAFMMGEDPDAQKKRRTPEQEEQISQFRQLVRPQAEAALKRMLVVEHIADREGLRASAEDVDARVEALAEARGRSPGDTWLELEKSGRMQALESEITEDKVFDYLLRQNTVA
jgi:trigger factor